MTMRPLQVLLLVAVAVVCFIPRAAAAKTVRATGGRIKEFALSPGIYPGGLTPGPNGTMWFPGQRGRQEVIGRVLPSGSVKVFRRGLPRLPPNTADSISSFTWGPDGNLWFSGLGQKSIGWMTPAGKVTILKSGAGLPQGFEGFPLASLGGSLYIEATWRSGGGKVAGFLKIGSDGSRQLIPWTTKNVVGVTVGADGNFWGSVYPHPNGLALARITPSGVVTQYSPGPPDFRYLCGAEPSIASDGSIWCDAIQGVASYFMVRLDPTTGQMVRFSSQTPAYPQFQRPAGGWWWLTSSGKFASSLQLRAMTASGQTSEIASTHLSKGTALAPEAAYCLGADDHLYLGVLAAIHGSSVAAQLKVQSLGVGATSASTVQTFSKRYRAQYSFESCTADSHGNLWFVDNSDPTPYPKVHHARIGRITVG